MRADEPMTDYEAAEERLRIACRESVKAPTLTKPYWLLQWVLDRLERFLERVMR